MWHGKYQRWTPIPEWSNCRVYVEAVHDDWEGFRIWLRHHDESKGMLIIRCDPVLLYDSAGEHNRIGAIKPEQPDLEFPHVFWTVEDSELLSLFHRQSCETHSNQNVKHYAFLSCNQCIDILSNTPPTFTAGGE